MTSFAGDITLFIKVNKLAGLNRNLSSSQWGSFPFSRFFLSIWAGPIESISCQMYKTGQLSKSGIE